MMTSCNLRRLTYFHTPISCKQDLGAIKFFMCEAKSRKILHAFTTGASYTRLLLALCLDYKWSACEDLRDRVFGFHSFATKCYREAVPVDYLLHISEISWRLIEHHEQEH